MDQIEAVIAKLVKQPFTRQAQMIQEIYQEAEESVQLKIAAYDRAH